jgi:bifunctional non-homologous end joining protein LigD
VSQWHWVAVRSVRPTPVLCAARANSCKAPGTLCAFDVLSIEDEDLRALPQLDRKERLRQLVDGLSLVHYVERLDAQGEALFAKFANRSGGHRPTRADSSYKAGWRPEWVKVKNPN